jgi:two-component system response regulator AtoC
LNVLPLQLPPLRERKEDIPLLVDHFIQKYNELHGLGTEGIAEDALARLLEYSWAGNVRELENTIERAMILTQGKKIKVDSLPSEIMGDRPPWKRDLWVEEFSIKKANRILEEELIRKALKRTKGNRSQAAKILEISHPSLLSKMKEYSIEG